MKTTVITGSSSGLGAAIAKQCLAQHHRVIGVCRRATIDHPNYQHVTCDFSDVAKSEMVFKDISQSIEPQYLILSAGKGHFTGLESFSRHDVEELLAINFTSQVLLVKALLPQLKQQPDAKVIAIASEAALQGARKGSLYCASKFALRGFCQALRAECSREQLAVSIVNPGMCRTPFFDDLQFEPGDDEAAAITPQVIVDTVDYILKLPNTCVVEEINLQPMKRVIQRKSV